MHTHAAILSTGDEVLLGQIADANARFFAAALADLGIMPAEHAVVGDHLPTLVATLRRLAHAAPLVIMSGGLGPTDGDLTRPALAELLGQPLLEDPDARRDLEARLAARNRPVTARLLRQAQRPASARCLPNPHGTAPGLHARIPTPAAPHTHADLFCLPGPPSELRPMWAASVVPALQPDPGRTVATRLLHVVGLAESDCVERLGPLTARDRNPLVGVTASGAVLTVRIRFDGPGSPHSAAAALDAAEADARVRLPGFVFGTAADTLESAVLCALAGRNETLVTVESCTAGLLASSLADVPGSSRALAGGWVTYANALKSALVGVPPDLIAASGAVSEPVARAMAVGGLDRSSAHHALAITGIAGPSGGTPDKPVGTVWIAHARRAAQPGLPHPCDARRFVFPGSRADVRLRAARSALALLWFSLTREGAPAPSLLWQTPTAPA